VEPIIIGMINDSHCISLSMTLLPTLPIPCIPPEWESLRDDVARGWDERFSSHILLFRQWRRRVNRGVPEGDD
jgi:hypothetical protein